VKRTALTESIRHVNNFEKANTLQLQRYAEMTKKSEAIEKVRLFDLSGAEGRVAIYTSNAYTIADPAIPHTRQSVAHDAQKDFE